MNSILPLEADLVAVFFGDVALNASNEALQELITLVEQVHEATSREAVSIVYIGPASEALPSSERIGVLCLPETAQEAQELRQMCLINPVAVMLPELVIIEARTNAIRVPNGMAAMRAASLHPHHHTRWRTNARIVEIWPECDDSTIVVHNAALLSCGVYSKDPVRLCFQSARFHGTVEVPTPPTTGTEEGEEGEGEDTSRILAPPNEHTILISPVAATNLGVAAGETVVVQVVEPEPAIRVELMIDADDSQVDVGAVQSAAEAYFGTADNGKGAALLAALAQESMASSSGGGPIPEGLDASWLASYVSRAECKNRIVASGQQFALEGTQVSISSTEPQGAVQVIQDTEVVLRNRTGARLQVAETAA